MYFGWLFCTVFHFRVLLFLFLFSVLCASQTLVCEGWEWVVWLSNPSPRHWALLLPCKVHRDFTGKQVLRAENVTADNSSGMNCVSSGSHGFSEMKSNACFIGTSLKTSEPFESVWISVGYFHGFLCSLQMQLPVEVCTRPVWVTSVWVPCPDLHSIPVVSSWYALQITLIMWLSGQKIYI